MCLRCGDTEHTLNVHHKRYIAGRSPGEYHDDDLVTLCETCHSLEHVLKPLTDTLGTAAADPAVAAICWLVTRVDAAHTRDDDILLRVSERLDWLLKNEIGGIR